MKAASWLCLTLGLVSLASGCLTGGDDSANSEATNFQWQGSVQTSENNNNNVLESGETTSPKPSCTPVKNYCSQGIVVKWEICLTEKVGAQELVSIDLNGKELCSWVTISFDCVASQLVEGTPACSSGYCSFGIPSGNPGMLCGWKSRKFDVYNADGSLNERLSENDLRDFGYELLPIGP